MERNKKNVVPTNLESFLSNERGVAIITALLILMLLSFVAITSTHTVMTEKRIVRSEAVFEQNFYLAESAALEGLQKLDNVASASDLMPNELSGTSANANLIVAQNGTDRYDDLANLDRDGDTDFDSDDISMITELSEVNANTRRMVVYQGVASGRGYQGGSGSSLKLGGTRNYDFMAYGVTENNNGWGVIKMGYKKRF